MSHLVAHPRTGDSRLHSSCNVQRQAERRRGVKLLRPTLHNDRAALSTWCAIFSSATRSMVCCYTPRTHTTATQGCGMFVHGMVGAVGRQSALYLQRWPLFQSFLHCDANPREPRGSLRFHLQTTAASLSAVTPPHSALAVETDWRQTGPALRDSERLTLGCCPRRGRSRPQRISVLLLAAAEHQHSHLLAPSSHGGAASASTHLFQ